MDRLTHHDVTLFMLSLAILLIAAKLMGELARRFNQPAILGELIAGIILGPTVLGTIFPDLAHFFLPSHGGRAFATDGYLSLSVVLFLLVAGLEIDLSSIVRQGKAAFAVSLSGIIIPFSIGFTLGWFWPSSMGSEPHVERLVYAMFLAVSLSITAMPVIAKTLMDMNLYRTDLGMLVMASAAFDDLAGWIIFSVVLSLIQGPGAGAMGLLPRIGLTFCFIAFMLSAGRWFFNLALPWVQAHFRWPGGAMALIVSAGLLSASFTEWLGIHALFGAFLTGVAVADSRHFRKHTRTLLEQFIGSVIAPIFFASVGLRVNFVANFDPALCAKVLAVACIAKVFGCTMGARLVGIQKREAWALGFCMNARGVMEIVLGLVALQYGVISERMFVALTVMAVVTSMTVGPTVEWLLDRKKRIQFTDYLKAKGFVNPLFAPDRRGAIVELAAAICPGTGLDEAAVCRAVIEREEMMSTSLGEWVAVPHARIEGISAPLVAVGLSRGGIDFDAPDGHPAHVIFLLLTPTDDQGAQVHILADIARKFSAPGFVDKALEVGNYTELLALLKSGAEA